MEEQEVQDSLRILGKLFEEYRQINPNNLRQGYPQELKKRLVHLLKKGVNKNKLLQVTKISPPTLSIWIQQYNKENIDLPNPKELKIIENLSDTGINIKTARVESIIEKYCAKINTKNGISIELTEQGLLLSLNTLFGAV